MDKMRIAQTAFGLLFAAGSVVTLVRQQMWEDCWEPGQVVYRSQSWSMDVPEGHSDEEMDAVMVAIMNDDPIPPGWSVDMGALIEGMYTGIHDGDSHEKLVTVTLEDESPDLESAELRLDGELVSRATRDDGSIVDEAGMAIATLPLWLPMPPFELELTHTSASGSPRLSYLRVR